MEKKNIKTALIDGYLDEPSCLGVPPYISPHIRYTYGSLLKSGIDEEKISYFTIDQLRENWQEKLKALEEYDLVIIIAGTTVPGHYLGGKPISFKEIKEIGKTVYYPQKLLGGPITLLIKEVDGYDFISREITAKTLSQKLTGHSINDKNLASFIREWAILGARLSKRHPSFPNLICEIESFRGCPRVKHCAFCSERLKKTIYQRQPKDIIDEVKALAQEGNHYYRLGCQTDLLLYQAKRINKNHFKLNPGALEETFAGIRDADPKLKVLHLDNINPANIINYPEESRQILETIVRYNTPGDIAAFGLESADPLVLKENNIESDPDNVFKAIEIMNEIGAKREKGVPKLLPGINLLHGLIGEREETMEYNYQYLKKIYQAGLMLRRINIRQVVSTNNYPLSKINEHKFKKYKEKINKEINKPMLARVFPTGTIIDNVLIEAHKGKLSFARQLGTYPILIGIPGNLELNKFYTVRVIDHGYRSITALRWPFSIENASLEELEAIPGIGKKRALKIFSKQAKNIKELKDILGKDFPLNKWQDWFFPNT
ncbi:radical SAM protein [Natronospora cellulosivora (SeqCode)]